MLLAIITVRGIQSTSALKRSYSNSLPPKSGMAAALESPKRRTHAVVRRGRMEAQPDGGLLFLQHIERGQQAPYHVSQQRGPALADECELSLQRVGGSQRRRAQQIDQVLVFRTEARARFEVRAQSRRELFVRCRFGEVFVGKQLGESSERGIQVGEPEHHQLFQGNGPIGDAAGRASEPFGRALPAAIDCHRGELIGKCQQTYDRALPAPIAPRTRRERQPCRSGRAAADRAPSRCAALRR